MTKKNSVIILSLAVILLFSLTSCNTDGDDGGQGADFDAAQYYTKTEVDALIAGAVTQAVAQATPDQYTITPIAADGPPKEITTDITASGGWDSNKAGPWTVPTGANFGAFKIEIGSTTIGSATHVYIGANNVDQYETYLLEYDNMVIDLIFPTSGSSSIYAWTDDSGTTGSPYTVTSLFWIK